MEAKPDPPNLRLLNTLQQLLSGLALLLGMAGAVLVLFLLVEVGLAAAMLAVLGVAFQILLLVALAHVIRLLLLLEERSRPAPGRPPRPAPRARPS